MAGSDAVTVHRGPVAGRRRTLLIAGLALVGLLAVAAAQLAPFSGAWPADVAIAAAGAVSGWTFWFLGLYAYAKRPDNRVGPLMMAVPLAFSLTQIGWIHNDVTFTLGVVLFEDLGLVVLGHLFLAFPTGRLESGLDRALVFTTYGWWFVSKVSVLAFWDFRAAGSRYDNVLLVHSDNALAGRIDSTTGKIAAVLPLLFLYALFLHWHRATPAGRRVLSPVLWASLPTAAWVVARSLGDLLQIRSVNDLVNGPLASLALTALPIGFAVGLFRSRLGRSRVGDLVVELGEAPEPFRVRDTLARVLRDPSLKIAYRLPGSETYVDGTGSQVTLSADGDRVVTPIEREGTPIAALVHDPAVLQDPDLLRSAVAATRLAVENERLNAEVRAQLEEVRASRVRIVEAGDAERRRVERNLHDGAQQRLVALSLSLRMLRERAARGTDDELVAGIENSGRELKEAIRELRELARGIHPAILTEEGLGAAIWSLADRSPIPVRVMDTPSERMPDAVEATAYYVVSEALANVAKYACATHAEVRATIADGRLSVDVRDDGAGGADLEKGSGLRGLEDRVAALGGVLTVVSPVGAGTLVRGEIPIDGQ